MIWFKSHTKNHLNTNQLYNINLIKEFIYAKTVARIYGQPFSFITYLFVLL